MTVRRRGLVVLGLLAEVHGRRTIHPCLDHSWRGVAKTWVYVYTNQGRRNVASRGGAELRKKGISLWKGESKNCLFLIFFFKAKKRKIYLISEENIQYTRHYNPLMTVSDSRLTKSWGGAKSFGGGGRQGGNATRCPALPNLALLGVGQLPARPLFWRPWHQCHHFRTLIHGLTEYRQET